MADLVATGYEDWDADGNDEIGESEFNDGVYDEWDTDDNDYIDETEFSEQA